MTLTPTLMLGASTIAMSLRMRGDLGLLRLGEAGGADHRLHAQLAADRQVRQRALGAGEVDQHLRRLPGPPRRSALMAHAARAAQEGGGILADGRAAGHVERAGQRAVVGAACTASISMRPMRPEAPATAIAGGSVSAAHGWSSRRLPAAGRRARHLAGRRGGGGRLRRGTGSALSLLFGQRQHRHLAAPLDGVDRGDELASRWAGRRPSKRSSTSPSKSTTTRGAAARYPGAGG